MAHHGEEGVAVNGEGIVAGGESWLYIYTEESDLSTTFACSPTHDQWPTPSSEAPYLKGSTIFQNS